MLVRRVRPRKPRLDGNLPDFDPVRREVLKTFGPASGTFSALRAEILPRMNITQDDDNLYLHAEIPGIDPDQLSISALRDSVSVAGKGRLSGASDCQERGDCAFDYTVALPAEVDAEGIDARYCDGVLALTLPKAQSSALEQRPS